MRIIKKTSGCVLTALLAFAMLCSFTVKADAAADSPSLDFTRTGSVSLTLSDSDGDTMTDGALAIYEVASLYYDDGDMAYAYTDAFGSCAETLDVNDTELAGILAAYVSANAVSGTRAAISADGTVSFNGLELGLYLVMQSSTSTGFEDISPFLVTVPYAENDAWVYDVDASPKVEITTAAAETPGVTPVTPGTDTNDSEADDGSSTTESSSSSGSSSSSSGTLPQTGQLNWPIPILAICGLVLFSIGWCLYMNDRRAADGRDNRNYAS